MLYINAYVCHACLWSIKTIEPDRLGFATLLIFRWHQRGEILNAQRSMNKYVKLAIICLSCQLGSLLLLLFIRPKGGPTFYNYTDTGKKCILQQRLMAQYFVRYRWWGSADY
jgi:hypothetical protein